MYARLTYYFNSYTRTQCNGSVYRWSSLNFQALSVLREQNPNQARLIDHVGFILISLFDGFAIISAIDLKAPGWLVAVIAVGAVAIGIYAINLRKKALTV